jgi:uncharacterized integral membrane protein (TIGR00698 family)
MEIRNLRFFRDVLVAGLLAGVSGLAGVLPPFDHFGGISLALLAGMLTKAFFWKPDSDSPGLAFAAKTLLRVGIVLLGFRLNLAVLTQAGPRVILFDLFMVSLGVALVSFVLRRAGFEPVLAALAAVGSSICGASAIAAAAPGLRATKESSALAIVVCTLVGTIATFLLIPLQSLAGLAPAQYGILAGATLHEVAQVVGNRFTSRLESTAQTRPEAIVTGRCQLVRPVFSHSCLLFALEIRREKNIAVAPLSFEFLDVAWLSKGPPISSRILVLRTANHGLVLNSLRK